MINTIIYFKFYNSHNLGVFLSAQILCYNKYIINNKFFMPEENKPAAQPDMAGQQNQPQPMMEKPDPKDVEENKLWGILAYILFFLPLLFAKDSKFAMYHAKQGLILFIFALLVNVIGSIVPIVGWFIVLPLGNIVIIIFAVIGIINAAKGETKELPWIGQFAKSFKF